MKAIKLVGLLCVVLILGVSCGYGQTYDLQFLVVQNNGVNFAVKVQVKSTSTTFNLGDANLVFSYPTSVLGSPTLLTAHNFSGGLYAPMALTQTSDRVSANIVYDGGSGSGSAVGNTFGDVLTIRFNVLNINSTVNLTWRSSGASHTVVFNDLFALVNPGTLSNLSSAIAPTITSPPANKTVTATQTATFNVTATGLGPLLYQWQKNSVDIVGATSSAYTTPVTSSADSASVFRCIVSNIGGSTTSNGAVLTVLPNPSGIFSDDFSVPGLDPRWTFVNPRNDATISLTGTGTSNARLSITVPGGGQSHDLWTGGAFAPRLLQSINNTDFEVDLKFESAMTSGSQLNGVMIQQDTMNYLRFDFVRSATSTKIFAASITNNTATQRSSIVITSGNPLYLRVRRTRDVWLSFYSYNGTTWTQAASFGFALNVQKIGPFAGNAGSPVPAFTSLVDYFFNTLTPISPEDPAGVMPPSITTHPSNQTVASGQTAAFSVVAGGTLPLTYQWQKNGVDIGGATSSSYTTPATVQADSGSTFRCRVTNSASNVTSNSAVLNVGTAPNISSHPTNQTVVLGSTASFNITSTGTVPLSYQWQKNGVDIGAATSSSYTTPATVQADSGSTFRCRVTNAFGNVTSNSAVMHVVNAPSITAHPTNQTVTLGSTATFNVAATGTSPLSYQWQKNGVDIGGATSSSYTTPATVQADSGSTFRCRVTNAFGNTTSNSAVLNVVVGPTITTHPVDQTAAVGSTATFTVAASGTPPISYQWQKNSSNIPGATNASYTTPALAQADSGFAYRCLASNVGGSTPSNAAILSVLVPPNVTVDPSNQTVSPGGTATFNVTASGSATLSYQWQKNNVDIGGAMNSSYTTPSAIVADSGATFRCRVTNPVGADTSNPAILSVVANTDASGIISDNFNSPSLNTSLWTYVNPLNDAMLTMTGSQISIAIPGAVAHDAWTGGNFAPKVLQNANNTDFQVEAKFTSTLNAQYQSEGIIAHQDTANYIRFDFVRSSVTRIFAASILNNTATTRSNITITAGNPLYLRVKRQGNTWTSYYSYNGTTWTAAASFSHTLTVTKVGPFFVNAGSPPPAFTGTVDYFFNTAFPIVPTKASGQPTPAEIPDEFSLSANYPNPFNPSTVIGFALPVDAHVLLRVYNSLGQEVRTLVDDTAPAGHSQIEWDGRNAFGETVGTGMYFCRFEAVGVLDPSQSFSHVRKMLLVK